MELQVSSTKTSAANHNVVFSGKAREEEKRSEGRRTHTREREREREREITPETRADAPRDPRCGYASIDACATVAVLSFCCPLVAMEDHNLFSHTNRL